MNIEQINNAIAKLSLEDLRKINPVYTARLNHLIAEAKNAFYVNQKVRFEARSGNVVYGTIIKMNKKTVHVQTNSLYGNVYRVPPTMLEAC